MIKDIDKLIKEKIEELNQIIQDINKLQEIIRQKNVEALKLDGEIGGYKKIKELDKK